MSGKSKNGKSKRASNFCWKRDRGRCFYCTKPLTWSEKTIDHVIPRSKGGSNQVWNFVISCEPCNSNKGDDWPSTESLSIVFRRKVIHQIGDALGFKIKSHKNRYEYEEVAATMKVQQHVFEHLMFESHVGMYAGDGANIDLLKGRGTEDG